MAEENLDPATVYDALRSSEPSRLGALPREHGIYALHDHLGEMRYVGVTAKDRLGFYGRINGRHVGGSEERSHKFSHAYNTGRMWRSRKDAGPDGRLAKGVRMEFARRYCRATYVVVPARLHGHLTRLEAAVQALAPEGQLLWGDVRGFLPYQEPVELVGELLDALASSTDLRAALDRQSVRCAAVRRAPPTPVRPREP